MNEFKIDVSATPNQITGEVVVETNIMGQIMREVLQTREYVTRKALVSMGWTEPGDDVLTVVLRECSTPTLIAMMDELRVVGQHDIARRITEHLKTRC